MVVRVKRDTMAFEHTTTYVDGGQEDELVLTIPYDVLPIEAKEHFLDFSVECADIEVDLVDQKFVISYKVWHG